MNKQTYFKMTQSALALMLIGAPFIQTIHAEENYQMNYIEGTEEDSSDDATNASTAVETESRTQDQVSMDEGIAAEQTVVKITSDGYVTSHGDHYHYYSGQVPAESIFIETLVWSEDGEPSKDQQQYEIEGGWIVKDQDSYFVYFSDTEDTTKIRTTDELMLQSKGIHPKDAKAIVDMKNHTQVNEEALLISEIDRTPEEVAKEKDIESEHIIMYVTDEVYVTSHGIDYHLFNGQIPKDTLIYEQVLTPLDYKLNDEDVVYEIDGGAVVKIDDKDYVYLKDRDSNRFVTLEQLKKQFKDAYKEFEASGKERKEAGIHKGEVGPSGSRDGSGRYVTSDGYVFSPYDVIQDLGDGFIVPHGDHFHFIPKSDLTASELSIANAKLGKQTKKPEVGEKPRHGDKDAHHQDGPYTTDDGYVFTVESITSVDAKGIVGKHGSHYHWVPFADLSDKELKRTQEYIRDKFGISRDLLEEFGRKKNTSVEAPSLPEREETSESTVESHDTTQEIQETTQESSQEKNLTELDKLLNQLYALPIEERYHEGDGLVLDPKHVQRYVEMDGEVAYIVPHGDHHHVVKESLLSKLERKILHIIFENKGQYIKDSTNENVDKKINLVDKVKTHSNKGNDGKPYTTSDGYTFTPESIIQFDDEGILAEHHGHTHYIPLEDLEAEELKEAEDYINKVGDKVKKIAIAEESEAEIKAKLTFLSLQTGVDMNDLKVTGDQVIIPHGDHTHTKSLKDIPSELNANQYDSVQEYRDEIVALKMNYLALKYKAEYYFRDKGNVYLYLDDAEPKVIALNEVMLPLKYEDFDATESLNEQTAESTIEDKKSNTEEITTESEETSQVIPEENTKIDTDTIKRKLAEHYRVDISDVQYFSQLYIVQVPNQEENIIVSKADALSFMNGNPSVLPPLSKTKKDIPVIEESKDKETTEENSKSKDIPKIESEETMNQIPETTQE